MKPARDLTGRRFGHLRVLNRAHAHASGAMWRCSCDCGKTCAVRAYSLIHGATKSCGCLRRSASQERMRALAISRAGARRYRAEDVIAEVFRDPLGRLAEYAKAALKGAR